MAIIYSYPLNDDIKPLDELVGTTEKNINGQLKTVTRNFLLQDLAEFFIVDGGLQKTITLTTTDTNGAATLNQLTGILNIPRYDQNGFIKLTSLSSIATGLTYNNTTGVFSLSVGYSIPTTASQTNWDTAYNYRLASLTTTGTSGPATLAGNVLNIPDYSEGIVDSPITIVNGSSLFSTGLPGTGTGSDASNSNFFGNEAGYQATNASNSNFIGTSAGRDATNANHSNFIGISAGQEAMDANYSNLFGYNVGSSFTDNNIGANNIIIGTNISLPDAAINSINLGGVLFGTGTYLETSNAPSITPTSGGRIGIGVVEPTNTLHIYSEAEDTSGLRLERLTSSSTTSTGQAIGVDADGNVVTVEGGGGSQDLQSVTDVGATTTKGIIISKNNTSLNGVTSTLAGWDWVSDEIDTYAVKGVNANVNSNSGTIQGTGVFGQGSVGVWGIGDDTSNGGIGVYAEGGFVGMYSIGVQTGIKAESDNGTALFTVSSDGINASLNLGSTSKGLVINSGGSSTGNTIEINKGAVNKLTVNQEGELTATKLIKSGGFDFQFLKADGSVDNNTYLTSADLPSTLDLYATTSPDPVIAGYTALVRNIADSRYNTVAVAVPTPTITGTLASPTFCGAVISDPSILLGNPGVFNFSVIGKIRRSGGSTSSGADFFYGIYKRDLAGVETLIANSAPVAVPANGGIYVEYISIALWNNGIFLSTDRIVLKFYGVKTGGGSGATYEFLFGGSDPVRGTAAISSAIIPNIYLRDLADVEKTPALNNEILYWNDPASLWEHSLAENLVPLATATQKGLVSTGTQTIAGTKTFSSQTILGDGVVGATQYGLTPQATVGSTSGGVFDIRNTNTNIVAGNTVGTLQFSAKDDDSVAYLTAQIKAITQNGIGAGSSGKTDLIFYTSNGSSSIERVKMNDLGLVINSEVTSTMASFDSNKSIKSLTTADGYPSLVELKYVSGVTSAIQTQLNGKITNPTTLKFNGDLLQWDAPTSQWKSNSVIINDTDFASTTNVYCSTLVDTLLSTKQATLISGNNIKSINGSSILGSGNLTISASAPSQNAFTMLANNTAPPAVPTEQPFKNLTNQPYTSTIVWGPTGTAPSGTTAHTYSLSQVGNLVTLTINLSYSSAGAATLSTVACELPSTAPTPTLPTSVTATGDVINYGTGMIINAKGIATTTASFCGLRLKSTAPNVFEVVVSRPASTYRYAYITIQYFV